MANIIPPDPADVDNATGTLKSGHGGTGLTTSGTDNTQALKSDGSGGFVMGSVGTGSVTSVSGPSIISWANSTTTPTGTLVSQASGTILGVSGSATAPPTFIPPGTADQIVSVKHTGDGLEYKTITGSTTITSTPAAGSITLSIPSSVPLAGSPTTTTQSASDNSTKIATTAYTDAAVSGVSSTAKTPGGNSTAVPTFLGAGLGTTPTQPFPYTTSVGTVTAFTSATSSSLPVAITAGPDGNMWYGMSNGTFKIAKISPTGTITEYTHSTLGAGSGFGNTICVGPDLNIWAIGYGGGQTITIVKITTAGTMTDYTQANGTAILSLTAAGDGNVWFIAGNGTFNKITTSGSVTSYVAPHTPKGTVVCGPDGRLYSYSTSGAIIACTTSGVFTEYTPTGARTDGPPLTVGSDGRIWTFTSGGVGQDKLAAMTVGGTFSYYTLLGGAFTGVTAITSGADGNIWLTSNNNSVPVVAAYSTNGVQIYSSNTTEVGAGIAPGVDGNIWFTKSTANTISSLPLIRSCGSITLSTPLTTTSGGTGNIAGGVAQVPGKLNTVVPTAISAGYMIPPAIALPFSTPATPPSATAFACTTANAAPQGICVGSDGRIWVSETLNAGKLSAFDPYLGTCTEYTTGNSGGLGAICTGVDGNIWTWTRTSGSTNGIGKISTSGTGATQYGHSNGTSKALISGPDGRLWFGQPSAPGIAAITTANTYTAYTMVATPTTDNPQSMVVGSDGRIWVTTTTGIAAVTTAGVETDYAFGGGSQVKQITLGADGSIYGFDSSTGHVLSITTAGVVTDYGNVGPSSGSGAIAAGPDGSIWMAGVGGNTIIKYGLAPTVGAIVSVAAATSSAFANNSGSMILGPDNCLWVTESGSNKPGIERVNFTFPLSSIQLSTPLPVASGGSGSSTAATARTAYAVDTFQSSDQTITAAGALTIAHGLARTPQEVWFALVNQSAEANYTANQVVFIGGSQTVSIVAVQNDGFSTIVDGTNLTIRFGSDASTFTVPDATTGAATAITNNKWKARFFAR